MMSTYTDLATAAGRDRVDSGALHRDAEDRAASITAGVQDGARLRFESNVATEADDRYNPTTKWESFKVEVNRIMSHIAFRLFTMLLIIVDVIVVMVDIASAGDPRALDIATITIVIYFMIEVNLRLLVKGRSFFHNWIDVLDYVIVTISFIVSILSVSMEFSTASWTKLIVVGRLIRVVLLIRLVTEQEHLRQASRLAVSQNKRRYQKDGFDLDLCYVTDRVIAMSFPSKGIMSFYRNPINEVVRFFDTKYNNHYKIFNLCSERMYNEALFHYRVERIYIDDHNVPTVKEMVRFAAIAREWMDADERNIIAIHCKGGKGRTGTMVAVWLIESGQFEQAKDSLEYFGARRTDLSVGKTFQGVQTPSQSRYVGYYEIIKTKYRGEYPPERTLQMDSVIIKNVSGIGVGDGSDLSFRIITEAKVWEFNIGRQIDCQYSFDSTTSDVTIRLEDKPVLSSDVKIQFRCSSKTPKGYDGSAFYFWFHTAFIEDNVFHIPREEVDNPHKESTWSTYRQGFGVTIHFSPV